MKSNNANDIHKIASCHLDIEKGLNSEDFIRIEHEFWKTLLSDMVPYSSPELKMERVQNSHHPQYK